MKHLTSFAAICAVSALAAAPALAVSSHANPHASENTTKTHPSGPPASTPGPSASMPAKAKAYGVLCQKESKKHVAGTKGTPFSQCVNALAKVATDTSKTPAAACSTESKKHVAGTKGTPFSRCVSAAAKLRASQRASSTTGS
jgi:hypothetical protein